MAKNKKENKKPKKTVKVYPVLDYVILCACILALCGAVITLLGPLFCLSEKGCYSNISGLTLSFGGAVNLVVGLNSFTFNFSLSLKYVVFIQLAIFGALMILIGRSSSGSGLIGFIFFLACTIYTCFLPKIVIFDNQNISASSLVFTPLFYFVIVLFALASILSLVAFCLKKSKNTQQKPVLSNNI